MSTVRIRNQSLGTTSGSILHIPSGVTTPTVADLGLSHCEDVVGNFPNDNPLYIEKRYYKQLGRLSGQAPSFPTFRFDNVQTGGQPWWDHISLSGAGGTMPSVTQAVTMAAARTNPSRPDVDMPVLLWEILDSLRTIPEKLFDSGSKYKKYKSNGNSVAAGNFGWIPLYSDVAKILDFSRRLDNRTKELSRALGPEKSGASINLWADSGSQVVPELTIWSTEGGVTAEISRSSISKRWVSCRWVSDTSDVPSAAELRALASSQMHGWRLTPDTIWEALPWSWLFDYFGNIGDYLKATRNTVGAHLESGCVMTHTITTSTQIIKSAPLWFSVVPGVSVYETKVRVPGSLGLEFATIPLIGAKQLVTLAGIAANLG